MSLLPKLLALLGLGAPAKSAPAKPGPAAGGAVPALSGPPELTSEVEEEGFQDLVLYVEGCATLPMGSQELRASANHRGQRVGLEVIFGADWREGQVADRACYAGAVTVRSIGAPSDALLRAMDELYGTKAGPAGMAKLTGFECLTLKGDPRDLRQGPVKAKLFLEGAEGGDGYAELYANVDLAARRLEIHEKDPGYRAAIVKALAGGA